MASVVKCSVCTNADEELKEEQEEDCRDGKDGAEVTCVAKRAVRTVWLPTVAKEVGRFSDSRNFERTRSAPLERPMNATHSHGCGCVSFLTTTVQIMRFITCHPVTEESPSTLVSILLGVSTGRSSSYRNMRGKEVVVGTISLLLNVLNVLNVNVGEGQGKLHNVQRVPKLELLNSIETRCEIAPSLVFGTSDPNTVQTDLPKLVGSTGLASPLKTGCLELFLVGVGAMQRWCDRVYYDLGDEERDRDGKALINRLFPKSVQPGTWSDRQIGHSKGDPAEGG
ncbi:hypothetical protein BGY98DRAFT_1178431 [Russula aff. rugulosa BPL654]|nr:hypothetical protein BGY98DRAFT_1178431 [Russula aff. rugulosa BPL654]